jgi:WD40 repeat protein
VILWDIREGQRVRKFEGHEADVMSVDFSRDGTKLVTGSYDKTARVWDVESGSELKRLTAHDDWVFATVFTKNGDYVFTGCGDGFLRMFRVSDGERIFENKLFSDVSDLALSADGELLAAGTSAGGVRLFRVDRENIQSWKLETIAEDVRVPKTPVLPEMSVTDYLRQHEQLLKTDSKEWAPGLATLAPLADAYTLHLLREIDEKSLKPDQAELRMRVMQQLETRRGDDARKLRVGEVGPMLVRAAAAELSHSPLETSLPQWVKDRLREQLSTAYVRRSLEKYAENPPVDPDGGSQAWGDTSSRVREYIAEILGSPATDGAAASGP